jgi:hypothetical protein
VSDVPVPTSRTCIVRVERVDGVTVSWVPKASRPKRNCRSVGAGDMTRRALMFPSRQTAVTEVRSRAVGLMLAIALGVSGCSKPQSAAPTAPTPVSVATRAATHLLGLVEDSAFRPLTGVTVGVADGPQAGVRHQHRSRYLRNFGHVNGLGHAPHHKGWLLDHDTKRVLATGERPRARDGDPRTARPVA